MLTIGMKGQACVPVTECNTAKTMGSGELSVFATPSMIALMESAASGSVSSALSPGQGTVGTFISVKHLAASPIGLNIRAQSELLEVEGKRLVFQVQAFDDTGLIGEGSHERFIIDNARFMERAEKKKGGLSFGKLPTA